MANKSIALLSADDILFRKLQFALRLVGFDCTWVRCEKEFLVLQKQEPAAVFFDTGDGYRLSVDRALQLRMVWKNNFPAPMFLLSADVGLKTLSGSYAVFDAFCKLPFFRQDIYKLLKDNRLLNRQELQIVPFSEALPATAIKEFLGQLQNSRATVMPVYAEGYHYPQADAALPGDIRDSISTLLSLSSRGVLERKIYDRVHRCPYCSASQINFRECCPQCHSIDFIPVELLHHFPCGYVGDSNEFRRHDSEELICPKCEKPLRHIGMDYEKPISSFSCNTCQMHFSIPAVRCRCFVCGRDFTPGEAVVQTFYCYTLRENFSGEPDAAGKSGENFSVTRENFIVLLRQNIGISRELGFEIQLVLIDSSGLSDVERHELLRLLHEFNRPVDVVYASPQGAILVLLFYISPDGAQARIDDFRRLRLSNPLLGKRKLNSRIYRFSGNENLDAEKLIDKLCMTVDDLPENHI